MTQSLLIRNQKFEIINATDILVTMLAEAIKGRMTDTASQAVIAYVIKSACLVIPPELINYRLIKSSDGLTEEIFTQNLDADEVTYFAGVLTVAMLEARSERLKSYAATEAESERVKSGISKLDRMVAQAQGLFEGAQLDILLRGVATIDTIKIEEELSVIQQERAGFREEAPPPVSVQKSKGFSPLEEVKKLSGSQTVSLAAKNNTAVITPSLDRAKTIQQEMTRLQAEMKTIEEEFEN